MQITTKDQARNANFLRNLKTYAANLSVQEKIAPCEWLDWLTDEYRDLRVEIEDEIGSEVFLDMQVFEVPSIDFWFRDFCKPVPLHVVPRLRQEAEGRVVAMSSILRARDPSGTKHF